MIEQKLTRSPNATVSIASAARSFSTLARIKNVLRSTVCQERLSSLGSSAVEAPEAKKCSFFFVFCNCRFILLSQKSDQSAIMSSLRSCRPPVYHTKTGESRLVPFPAAQLVNLSACSPIVPSMLNVEQGSCDYQF